MKQKYSSKKTLIFPLVFWKIVHFESFIFNSTQQMFIDHYNVLDWFDCKMCICHQNEDVYFSQTQFQQWCFNQLFMEFRIKRISTRFQFVGKVRMVVHSAIYENIVASIFEGEALNAKCVPEKALERLLLL